MPNEELCRHLRTNLAALHRLQTQHLREAKDLEPLIEEARRVMVRMGCETNGMD